VVGLTAVAATAAVVAGTVVAVGSPQAAIKANKRVIAVNNEAFLLIFKTLSFNFSSSLKHQQ